MLWASTSVWHEDIRQRPTWSDPFKSSLEMHRMLFSLLLARDWSDVTTRNSHWLHSPEVRCLFCLNQAVLVLYLFWVNIVFIPISKLGKVAFEIITVGIFQTPVYLYIYLCRTSCFKPTSSSDWYCNVCCFYLLLKWNKIQLGKGSRRSHGKMWWSLKKNIFFCLTLWCPWGLFWLESEGTRDKNKPPVKQLDF